MKFIFESKFTNNDIKTVELHYDNLPISYYVPDKYKRYLYDPQLADEVEDLVDFDYEVDVDDVVLFILEYCLSADEVEHMETEAKKLGQDEDAYLNKKVKDSIDDYVEKYKNKILAKFEEDAIEAATEEAVDQYYNDYIY